MAQELALLSPDKTILTFRIAGLGSRVLAHLLDLLIVAMLLFVVSFGLGIASAARVLSGELIGPVMLFLSGVGTLSYFVLFEGLWNGQTLGKKAAFIRVRNADGTPISFRAALARNLLRPADFLPSLYFLGLLAMFTNAKSQRIGDLVAGTVVLFDAMPVPRFTPAPHAMGVHPYESLVGELRGMTADEYAALKQLCDRFPELPAHISERFLREVWAPIARRRAVPEVPGVHPVLLAEAVVMRYGRSHGML